MQKKIFIILNYVLLISSISSDILKLMTYNIHFGNSIENKYSIEEIGKVIKNSKADIICLQEVDVNWESRSNYENTIQKLSELTKFYYFFAPIYNKRSNRGKEYPNEKFGVGFLSRYEIISSYNYNLSRWSTQKEDPQPGDAEFPPKKGGFGNILINIKGKIISVYNTHLDYRPNPPPDFYKSIREIQVLEMLEIINFENYPVILMGDMNCDTSAKEVFSPLFNYFNDGWIFGNSTNGYTFPSNNPNKRIDYILISKDLDVKNSMLIETQASDHLPVLVDIEF